MRKSLYKTLRQISHSIITVIEKMETEKAHKEGKEVKQITIICCWKTVIQTHNNRYNFEYANPSSTALLTDGRWTL